MPHEKDHGSRVFGLMFCDQMTPRVSWCVVGGIAQVLSIGSTTHTNIKWGIRANPSLGGEFGEGSQFALSCCCSNSFPWGERGRELLLPSRLGGEKRPPGQGRDCNERTGPSVRLTVRLGKPKDKNKKHHHKKKMIFKTRHAFEIERRSISS